MRTKMSKDGRLHSVIVSHKVAAGPQDHLSSKPLQRSLAMADEKTIEKDPEASFPRARGDGEISEADAERVSGGVPAAPGLLPMPHPYINK
jgi:hypothetical protein